MFQFAESEQLASVKHLDTQTFLHDLQNCLYFNSNIPIGYGLGSSGALCAAVYDRYCAEKLTDLSELKEVFSGMESFFHSASSGIDPLTSYIGKPLLIRHKSDVSVADLVPWQQQPIVFLIDTRLPRETGPLVRWFLDRSSNPPFAILLEDGYLPAHEALVQSWLSADAEHFWPNLQRVSQFQLDHFEPMVPDSFRSIWAESLENQQIFFKICGAGGGGFMLGFSKTLEPVHALTQHFQIVFPFTEMP